MSEAIKKTRANHQSAVVCCHSSGTVMRSPARTWPVPFAGRAGVVAHLLPPSARDTRLYLSGFATLRTPPSVALVASVAQSAGAWTR
jgi:hypothetical protein